MNVEEEIRKGLKKVEEKTKLKGFEVEIVNGLEASINGNKIRIGKDNPIDLIETILIHECYHIVLQIDQTKDFEEKDKGNIIPYVETKIKIWDKIKEDFPELSDNVESCKDFFGHKIN